MYDSYQNFSQICLFSFIQLNLSSLKVSAKVWYDILPSTTFSKLYELQSSSNWLPLLMKICRSGIYFLMNKEYLSPYLTEGMIWIIISMQISFLSEVTMKLLLWQCVIVSFYTNYYIFCLCQGTSSGIISSSMYQTWPHYLSISSSKKLLLNYMRPKYRGLAEIRQVGVSESKEYNFAFSSILAAFIFFWAAIYSLELPTKNRGSS